MKMEPSMKKFIFVAQVQIRYAWRSIWRKHMFKR